MFFHTQVHTHREREREHTRVNETSANELLKQNKKFVILSNGKLRFRFGIKNENVWYVFLKLRFKI